MVNILISAFRFWVSSVKVPAKSCRDPSHSNPLICPFLHISFYCRLQSMSLRHIWEHSVPNGKSERASITFRSWIGPKKRVRTEDIMQIGSTTISMHTKSYDNCC